MILFLSITGIFLSLLLVSFNARNYRSSVFLGLFFLLVSLYSLYQFVLLYSQSVFWLKVFLFLIPLLGTSTYFIGPVLFWYVRSVISDDHRLHRRDLLHLLPAAVFFLSALPALFTPFDSISEAAELIAQNPTTIGNYKPSLLSSWVSYQVLFLSRPILIFAYTCTAIITLINYLLTNDKALVFSGQSFMTRWLIILLGSLFVLVVSHILLMFDFMTDSFNLHFLFETLRIISAIGLTGMLVSPFFFPGILYGLPRLPHKNEVSLHQPLTPPYELAGSITPGDHSEEKLSQRETQPGDLKTATPVFEADYLARIGEQTEACMIEFRPYLQQDFNLAQLAVLLKIPAHHLAYYFREIRKMSFTDFRNRWRIEHAKKLIREGKSGELTLEAIGILSGFSSRNTFLNAFKKAEGISPNMYKSQINQS